MRLIVMSLFHRERFLMNVCRKMTSALLVGMAGLLLAGCGTGTAGPERVVVAGTITLDGQPIPHGEIRFIPEAGTVAPSMSAVVQDGQFRADVHGGVPVGTHRVEIRAIDPPVENTADAPAKPRAPTPTVPAKYNEQSELQLTVKAGSDPVQENYDLKS